jgi:drug/metabolite transporter (DMT)-like permease
MSDGPRDPRTLAVLLGIGGIWGASFLFIKVAVDEISPLELVAARLFLGAVTVALIMRLRRMPLSVDRSLLGHICITATVSNILPFALIAWGEEHIDSGIASVLNGTMPIFTAVIAAAILVEERFTAARAAGLALGFAGVVALSGNDVLDITDSSVLGQLAVVASAACYGAGAVYMRMLLGGRDPASLSILQLVVGTVIAVPLVFLFEGSPDYSMSLEGALCLLALGIFGTGFAYIAYLWLIERIGSVRASLVTYIIPIVGLFLGWLVLDERIGVNTLFGAALIIAGVAAVMRGPAPARERLPVAEGVAAD